MEFPLSFSLQHNKGRYTAQYVDATRIEQEIICRRVWIHFNIRQEPRLKTIEAMQETEFPSRLLLGMKTKHKFGFSACRLLLHNCHITDDIRSRRFSEINGRSCCPSLTSDGKK